MESLKSLGWLLLWGGLFYVVMRHGCGAHMMGAHGHGGHGGHDDATPGRDAKDPVCGMTVNSRKAAAAAVRDGKTHYFCSALCRDKFEQTPDKYLGPTAEGAHHG